MADLLIVKSKVKDFCEGMNVSSDFAESLNSEVLETIEKACVRARENGRKTVSGRDV